MTLKKLKNPSVNSYNTEPLLNDSSSRCHVHEKLSVPKGDDFKHLTMFKSLDTHQLSYSLRSNYLVYVD